MIVGRREEIAELNKLYYSDRPEFVAVYGRRRVGKTFLIKQALKRSALPFSIQGFRQLTKIVTKVG